MEPFHHRDAAANGLTLDQVRGPSFVHPTNGVAIGTDSANDLDAVCRSVLLALPADAVFTHLTAATLRGWWLPFVPEAPLIACTSGDAAHLNRRGVYVRRCEIPPGHRATVRDIPVASAAWTIVELAEHLTLIDLVTVIDCALYRKDVTVGAIRDTMRKGRRGVRVLRRALELCDGRSESPWESVLRLLFQLSGIEVDPQQKLHDPRGHVIARVDLRIRGTNRVAEYVGAGHRDLEQHRDDLRREKAMARLGVGRYGYTEIEIRSQPALIVKDGEDALGLRHDPSRLKFWDHEFERSSLSEPGRRALIRRLRRFVRTTTPRPTNPATGANR